MRRTVGSFLRALISSEELEVDSLIVGAGLCIVALVLFTGYAMYVSAGTSAATILGSFGVSATSILGAGVGGGRRLRDGPSQGDRQ